MMKCSIICLEILWFRVMVFNTTFNNISATCISEENKKFDTGYMFVYLIIITNALFHSLKYCARRQFLENKV